MTDAETLVELPELEEGVDVELKKAAGRDGRGELPKAFFETYSAMANTNGGVIYLGIAQRGVELVATGIADVARVRKALWDGLNNRKQVSRNLLRDEMVAVVSFGTRKVIKVQVPRASRYERPVYVGENPLDGTYRRNYEGDYRCDTETVQRMIAEQVEDTRDAKVLANFGFEDLKPSTLAAYRQRFANTKPEHVWLGQADPVFLRSIGAWGKDRETGAEGLTAAGLLMFGKLRSILDRFPNYVLDYQERPEAKAELRWIDRLTTDGSWSGNLFDFYRLVIQKLGRDLRVPFRLERGTDRVDETPVHEALREALVNTLIHADYSGRASVLVVKRPDMFGFRNPGLMRVPVASAIAGGNSDCRNRNLQKMFQLVGLGDQAGSGVPKVYARWQQQHWRAPVLEERSAPLEQTLLSLRMVSLLPPEALSRLEELFGEDFATLGELERMILVTAAVEGEVTHARMNGIVARHPKDLSAALAQLQRDGFLVARGATRAKCYYLPGDEPRDGLAGTLGADGALNPFEALGASPETTGAQTTGAEAAGVQSTGVRASVARSSGAQVAEITDEMPTSSAAAQAPETTGVNAAETTGVQPGDAFGSDVARDSAGFEDEKVLAAALEALQRGDYAAAHRWALARGAGKSFWTQHDRQRFLGWSQVELAAELGLSAQKHAALLKGVKSVVEAVERYTEKGFAVDAAHRRLEQAREQAPVLDLDEFPVLRQCLDQMRHVYRSWADTQAAAFNVLCREQGFLPPAAWQQRNLFDDVVRPLAQESGATAYFMVDALRFELAEQLAASFSKPRSATVSLPARLAELPTVTEVGMNVLAPLAQGGKLRPDISDKGVIRGFRGGRARVDGPEDRQKAIHERVGGKSCPKLSLEDVLARDVTTLRKTVAEARVLIVHSEGIDKAGEKGVGLLVFEQEVRKLHAAVRQLLQAGVLRCVLTADHGFLLHDATTRAPVTHGFKTDPKRRHVVSFEHLERAGEVAVGALDLAYEMDESAWFLFPENSAPFDLGDKAKDFVHGGNSLQERVIPVLTIQHKHAAGTAVGNYRIEAGTQETSAPASRAHRLALKVVVQGQTGLTFGAPREMELALECEDDPTVQVQLTDAVGARVAGNVVIATVDRPF